MSARQHITDSHLPSESRAADLEHLTFPKRKLHNSSWSLKLLNILPLNQRTFFWFQVLQFSSCGPTAHLSRVLFSGGFSHQESSWIQTWFKHCILMRLTRYLPHGQGTSDLVFSDPEFSLILLYVFCFLTLTLFIFFFSSISTGLADDGPLWLSSLHCGLTGFPLCLG